MCCVHSVCQEVSLDHPHNVVVLGYPNAPRIAMERIHVVL